jgi:ADP-ribose pyrophosphatase
MNLQDPPVLIVEGIHVRLMKRGLWEYVTRKRVSGIVGIVAVTDEGKMLLVEQPRMPMGKNVIELPAGLAGDVPGHESEPLTEAARRELLEETGYEAAGMEYLTEGTSSAGITDEIISLFRATGLKKVGPGAGDGSEQIILHEISIARVADWLEEQRRARKLIDLKVYGALYFLRS